MHLRHQFHLHIQHIPHQLHAGWRSRPEHVPVNLVLVYATRQQLAYTLVHGRAVAGIGEGARVAHHGRIDTHSLIMAYVLQLAHLVKQMAPHFGRGTHFRTRCHYLAKVRRSRVMVYHDFRSRIVHYRLLQSHQSGRIVEVGHNEQVGSLYHSRHLCLVPGIYFHLCCARQPPKKVGERSGHNHLHIFSLPRQIFFHREGRAQGISVGVNMRTDYYVLCFCGKLPEAGQGLLTQYLFHTFIYIILYIG